MTDAQKLQQTPAETTHEDQSMRKAESTCEKGIMHEDEEDYEQHEDDPEDKAMEGQSAEWEESMSTERVVHLLSRKCPHLD
ncbi:hypothetical protein H0H92_015592, partial [Tricholoma furcatifolium]